MSGRIFENVIDKWTFCFQQFFFRQKLRVQALIFFPFPFHCYYDFEASLV